MCYSRTEMLVTCIIYFPVPIMFAKPFYQRAINPLPDDKLLDWSKLKQIADDIITHSHTMIPLDAPGKQAF